MKHYTDKLNGVRSCLNNVIWQLFTPLKHGAIVVRTPSHLLQWFSFYSSDTELNDTGAYIINSTLTSKRGEY